MKKLLKLNILFLTAAIVLFSASCETPGDGDDNETTTTTSIEETTTSTTTVADTGPGLVVEVYDPDKVYPGTTLLGDLYDARVIEVNMSGEVVWQYSVPAEYSGFGLMAIEADLLGNNNIQALFPGSGIFEISRGSDGNEDGEIVWSYLTKKISHDADRLPGFGEEVGCKIECDSLHVLVWAA